MPFCVACNLSVAKNCWIGHLRSNAHKNKSINELSDGVDIIKTAFRCRIASYRIVASIEEEQNSTKVFLDKISEKIKALIDRSLTLHTCIKVNFELFSLFLLFKNDSQEIKSFATKNFTVHHNYDFDSIFLSVRDDLLKRLEEFQDRDSGWSFLNNSHFEININKYEPLNASSFIDLPKVIKNKKACLNIKNDDQCCFLWCVMAALYPTRKHSDRVTSYPDFRDILNITGLSFPLNFSDIALFEKNNRSIGINIYGLKGSKTIIGPLYKSQNPDSKKCVHLLFFEEGSRSHYCLIKDLPRLVRSQITKHHGKLHFCENCLLFFQSANELKLHVCGGVATVLPQKGSFIQFKHYSHKQTIPFVMYADFETSLQTCQSSDSANTATLQHHVPVAFGYHVVCALDDRYNYYVSYRGDDCVDKFVQCLFDDAKKISDILHNVVPIDFNEKAADDFEKSVRCYICRNLLFFDKVKHHCHITGRYIGAVHNYCNLQLRTPNFIPIFFHNLSGYDCHLFIKKLGEAPGAIKIIPKTKENYISITKFIQVTADKSIQLRFVDSLKFLDASLNSLANTMDKNDYKHLRTYFPDDAQFNLLTRKGVYPYDYMTSWKCYKEKSLPSKNSFYNSLMDEEISNSDYKHAESVWLEFNIKDLGEYTDLYLKTDVLLLSDIFEKFRNTCKLHYHLDPAFYLTTPSLSFDAMLLKTGVKLELLDNLAMIRMFQDGIRGGVCMCSKRYAKANHKYLPDYDRLQSDSFIIYIDCNNLYGFSMCQSLPLSNFRFLERYEIESLNITTVQNDADYGYILEVDLHYPHHLHQDHNDFPFCPEKCVPPGGSSAKLVPNLYDKFNYVIHYIHLKSCLKHGLVLKKIHRVITFKQSPYLKEYIDLNTELRQKAESSFEQDFFKLLNNSIFGKTLENTEKRVNVKLVNRWNDKKNITKKSNCANKLIARPNFHSVSIFSDNLVAIQMKPEQVLLDKPIYIGFTVLELSKCHMYDYHYSQVKPIYGDRVQLCYTDTDSFIYEINCEDFYLDLKNIFLDHFDTSNYRENNDYNIPLRNKKVPGLFKDEMCGEIITEFVGLRSKLYCIKTTDKVIKKAKGVKKCVIRDFKVSDYEKVLFTGDVLYKKNILFKSIKHEIFTRSVNKIALSSNDDKRFILRNKISTKAWGHSSIS